MWINNINGELINANSISAIVYADSRTALIAVVGNGERIQLTNKYAPEIMDALNDAITAENAWRCDTYFAIAPLVARIEAAHNKSAGKKIDAIDFSNRTYNCLKRQGIETLEELASYSQEELWNIRNLGGVSLTEINTVLHQHQMQLREGRAI